MTSMAMEMEGVSKKNEKNVWKKNKVTNSL